MRKALTFGMILVGLALMLVAYFGLAAPWGAESVANSDPRMDFAPLLYVVGVMLAIGSALVYTMLPERD